jgi:hypothetical protein
VQSTDRRVQLRFDPTYVEGHAIRCGVPRREAKRLAAAAAERQARLKRVRAGIAGRPSDTRSPSASRWQASFESLPDYDYAAEASMTLYERHVQVYLFDWPEHPEDWPRDKYPADPAHPESPDPATYRPAASRVRKALIRQNPSKSL